MYSQISKEAARGSEEGQRETLVAGAGVLLLLLLLARNRSECNMGTMETRIIDAGLVVVYRWGGERLTDRGMDYNFYISSVHVMKAKGHA